MHVGNDFIAMLDVAPFCRCKVTDVNPVAAVVAEEIGVCSDMPAADIQERISAAEIDQCIL